ncbi:MAG: class I SAM-dependent methyltransferase [Chloroflexi bacterium]|nr:class I SAM-dependent methyltransferase [Chloroflexota bacterium]
MPSKPCRICGDDALHPFLDLGEMPIANAFLTADQLRQPEYKFRLRTGFCSHCLMVQLIDVVDPKMLFHDHYAYYSSISRVMDRHFAGLAELIGESLLYDRELPLYEIGSNDGILLEKLARWNPNAVGIEPSTNVAEVARNKGLTVVGEFLTPALANELAAKYGRAQLVVGGNVLCHIPNLKDLAKSLDGLLDEEGVFVFEDPYLLEIVTQLAYDQIYDEHVYYFSVSSLSRLFESHGLRLFRVQPIPVHGGSMRVFGCRAGSRRPTESSVGDQIELEQENGLGAPEAYTVFAERVAQSRQSLTDLLGNLKREGKRLIGYAAASKATVILNYCGIGPETLEYVCDTTPTKHGLFTPGTHVPIVPIETFAADYPDYAFVLAWNHLKEIVEKESAFASHGGKFITHIPTARVV